MEIVSLILMCSLFIVLGFGISIVHTQLRQTSKSLAEIKNMLLAETTIAQHRHNELYTQVSHIKDDTDNLTGKREEMEMPDYSDFDQRISRIKEELARENAKYPTYASAPSDAAELHPLVKNIPHDSVKTEPDEYPSVEYSD